MQIEAANLRLADAVRLAGEGEREIRKIEKNGAVRVWFRGDEELEQPSREFSLGDVVEIQRPGDLFKPAPPPKTVAEARERIFERMAALGWTVLRARFGRVSDYVTDPTDTVRLKLKPQAVALQVRWNDNGRWPWNSNTRSLGSIKEFATKIDEQSAWLIRYARERAEKRFKSEAAAVDKIEPSPTAAAPSDVQPVIVRYSHGEGVLLGGNTREHKDAIKALRTPYRFRYSRNLPGDAAWYVQRTRDTHQPRERIELLAAALRRSGVPVVVEYGGAEGAPVVERVDERKPAAVVAEEASTPARVGRPPDNTKRAAKLRELADKLETRANTDLSAKREENTRRRADMAAGIRDRARRQLVIAQTMRRAADAVEAGELEYVARISSQAVVEDLDLALRKGVWARDSAAGIINRDNDREPEPADVEFAEFPRVYGSKSTVVELLDASVGLPNLAEARKQAGRYTKQSKDDIEIDVLDHWAFRDIINGIKRDESRKLPYAAERLAEQIAVVDRLGRLGVVQKRSLQAALREYLGCCRGSVHKGREDTVAARKRELRFANIPGFVPTPRELAERIVSEAAIIPPGRGQRILEPSAGSGAIAEVIRKHHPDAKLDVIERQHSLREILKGDGFNLVGDDFLAFEPSALYDRVIMNPPFEKRQDTEHISRALDMIVPGGRLVAIASASLASRDDAETRKLRERIAELGGLIEPLPAGSFKASGTDVNTVIVVADLPPAAKVERPGTEAALVELARAHGIAPGESRTVGDRMKLLYEAEKRGWGAPMRTWLVKHRLIKPDWATEYGAKARGRLAFERGEEWPPPPARGESYSAPEYAGILNSLAHAPEARAAVELGTQWTEGVKQIPGAARLYRNHDLAAQVRRALETRTSAAFDESKNPAAARARYQSMKSALAALTRDMRLSLDSSLYDKSRDASQVFKTLCEISNDIARETLETIYGIEFVDRHDHYALCEGEQSLEDLGRKATQHAREEAQSKAKSNRERLADAKALLAVAADARSRGELTEKRFNLTYWRLHPELTGYKRKDRRLQVTWFPGFRRTRGVAPQTSKQATEAFVRGPSDHGFSTRVYRAENEVAVVEALIEEIRREAAELERTVAGEATSAPEPPKPPEHVTMPSPARPPDMDLAKRWALHEKTVDHLGLARWTNLEKTSCFVRSAGDVAVTLCPAIQKHAIGSCLPSDAGVKSKHKQLMLCQVDEDVEYYRGQTPGIIEARAEAENRLHRGRTRRGEALGKLPEPAVDDFEAQELYLDALVPTRIVYQRDRPLDPISVMVAPPHIITPEGKSTALTSWKGPIPDDASLEVRVNAGGNYSLREFEAKLGDELIPYRGAVARDTLREVLSLVQYSEREQLVKAGGTLHDVQFGRFGDRSLYWLRTRDGSKTYGPLTANGKPPSAATLREFAKVAGNEAQPLTTLPPGWTLDDTIVLAMMVDGRHVWGAWQPSTGLGATKGEGAEWGEPRRLPRRAKWGRGGFDDFMHRAAATLWNALEREPSKVRFRVAGPWLGSVFPSDYGERVQFDPPTGGELDVAQLEQEFAEYTELMAEHGEEDPLMLPRWAKVAPRRIAWAKRWLGAQRRAAKPKPAPKPKATTTPKQATSTSEAVDVGRREEIDMSVKTNGTKKAAAKKKSPSTKAADAEAQKAAAKQAASKKAAAKQAASKKAAAKKATAKKAAAKKATAKKATAKKATAKKPEAFTNGAAASETTTKILAQLEQPKPPSRGARPDAAPRSFRLRRNDVVRFRQRSQIAAGLGVGLDKEFKVEMLTTEQGRRLVVLRVGQGKHSALIKVPPGHLAIVRRGEEVPPEVRQCAARLARFKGRITPRTRRLLAELAGRA